MDSASYSPKQVQLVPESSLTKQMPLVPESSSPEKIQIEFRPLILASEPISVSNDSFSLFMLFGELLLKIGGFSGFEAMRNLIATCKYIRNRLDTWFLRALTSEKNPDRATSGFIVDAIGNKGNTCLWRNATFFIKDHNVPKDLSIHIFADTPVEKISSDEVRSMIIQLSGSPESYEESREFLKFIFSKVSFKNLKCLMFCGIELSNEFSQEIGTLNLDIFHMRNFHYYTSLAKDAFFRYCNSLKTLYVVHSDRDQYIHPPEKLKKLVIYCPKSSEEMIDKRRISYPTLFINVDKCHALKEM